MLALTSSHVSVSCEALGKFRFVSKASNSAVLCIIDRKFNCIIEFACSFFGNNDTSHSVLSHQ